MKKFFVAFLSFMLIASFTFVPVFASDLDSGIGDFEDDFITADYPPMQYPIYYDFVAMKENLPTSYAGSSFVWNLDQHFIWFRASAGSDGYAQIMCLAFDSSRVVFSFNSSNSTLSVEKADGFTGTHGYFMYIWDFNSSSWIYNQFNNRALSFRTDGSIWSDCDLLYSDGSVFYNAGISSAYKNELLLNSELGYDGFDPEIGPLPGGDDSGSSDEGGFWSDIWGWLSNFWDNLWSGIAGLFVPSDDFLENLFSEMDSAVDNSEFLLTLKSFMQDLNEFVHQDFTEPPEILVDLSAADSPNKINYGFGKVNVFDVSWFAKYRHLTDPFISAFLWISFIWLLVKRAPDLLNGAGMITGAPADIVEYTHMAERNSYASYKETRERKVDHSQRYYQEHKKQKS